MPVEPKVDSPLKPTVWMGSARRDLRAFPDDARNEAGHELFLVQRGEDPSDFKPMRGIGSGTYEIRIHTQTEHRVLDVTKHVEAVYVLHAFEKRTGKSAHRDVEIARRRFNQIETTRRQH